MKTTKFKLEGACCDKCDANIVTAVVNGVAGVTACSCDHKAAAATVTCCDTEKTNDAAIIKAASGTKNCHGQESQLCC